MPRARVYRHIDLQASYLGLEPFDLVGVGLIGWLAVMLNPDALAIDALVIALAYLALRIGKRGKPPGYTLDLARYALGRRAFLSASVPDTQGRITPFPYSKGSPR